MAYPFGGHPRFNDYLEWARLSEGCVYKSGIIRIGGKLDTTILIENPANGRHVIVTLPITEYLVPTMAHRCAVIFWLRRLRSSR